MITFANVTVRYPRASSDTLHDVSFAVAPGRITALVGPNGSGKSTLVRTLLRRVALTSGSITISGQPISALSHRDVAQRIAIVPQREETTFARKVSEYISLGRHPHRTTGIDTSGMHIVQEAAHKAGVASFLDRRTDELSGGEWQRVRLARALAQEGRALVLDEPTTFLDVAHEMATFELLDGLAKEGIAILLVSHQLNLVARFAHHMVLLHKGQIAVAGTPDTVMRGDILESVYEWPLVVTRDPAVNAPALMPLRRRA